MDMSGDPEGIMKRVVQRALAINSPNLTHRFYRQYQHLALLPPMDEVRVRQWLRELYPYEFRAHYTLQIDQDSTLELEGIRAVFQALLNNSNRFFTSPIEEALSSTRAH